mmetsp:Transcript_20649/g.46185  ORF Transcript_20649/g.46185 Transcript_20649/m.46185 type:complete len:202 (-) Transcript_20649:712-1317(-)
MHGHGRPGGMLPCNSPPHRKPPWTTMKPFVCILHVIMFLCDSFLPSFASRAAPRRASQNQVAAGLCGSSTGCTISRISVRMEIGNGECDADSVDRCRIHLDTNRSTPAPSFLRSSVARGRGRGKGGRPNAAIATALVHNPRAMACPDPPALPRPSQEMHAPNVRHGTDAWSFVAFGKSIWAKRQRNVRTSSVSSHTPACGF